MNNQSTSRKVYDWICQHPDLPESIAAQLADWDEPHRHTHCNAGHPMTFDNVILSGNQPRRCKICRTAWRERNPAKGYNQRAYRKKHPTRANGDPWPIEIVNQQRRKANE